MGGRVGERANDPKRYKGAEADEASRHKGGEPTSGGVAGTSSEGNSKPNQRHKANKLASRREKQKQSMNKRSGGM